MPVSILRDAAALPRKLRSAADRIVDLESGSVDRLVSYTRSGTAVWRDSMAALYALAAQLHSPRLPFGAKSLETSQEKHITVEQVWGQMAMLLRPVLRRLQDNVRLVERLYKGDTSRPNGNTSVSRLAEVAKKKKTEEEEEEEAASASLQAESVQESDLDEEIAQLLKKDAHRSGAQRGKGAHLGGQGVSDNAEWRYVFGKGNGDEYANDWGEGDEERHARGTRIGSNDEDGHSDADDEPTRRPQGRSKRAMTKADAGDGDSNAAAEEEMAALREMYGEDFENDGTGFAAFEESDQDLEEDLRFDRASHDGDEDYDRGHADALLDDMKRDGALHHARGDILNDDAGDFDTDGDDTMHASPADALVAEDAELQAALANPNLTALEKERLLEKSHIEMLERKRLYGTDWAMAGEAGANKRPRDALLEMNDLEFEYGMKAVPVITEEFTAKLEDRVKRRILDKHFDDVKRRSPLTTADTLVTTKQNAVLDSEKSKLSLMDLYEKDYMEKMRLNEEARGEATTQAEPLTEIEKDELRAIQMWKRLAQHLDALSNFYYTPKPVQQDLEARVRATEGQAPAIALESVGNFATTREQALAPQDLYRGSARKLVDVGADELRPEERRALRRAKKEEGKKFMHLKKKRQHQQRNLKAEKAQQPSR